MWKLSSRFLITRCWLRVFCFFAGLVLLCYEKQHCSEMTEDNSLQDNEERNNLLLTSRSVAAAWDGDLEHVPACFPQGYILVFVSGSATWCCNLWHYRCFPSLVWTAPATVNGFPLNCVAEFMLRTISALLN
jgi:hypothetical protein